ncbi:MAG TPA: CbiX/SirB N-terminal domain-containing protein [Bryobacteraceae bacterium]|nr:CbiX/SirB N-terminal domain-containing protein [Bryobacteraceae bacterium]
MTALVVFAHGSKVEAANEAIRAIAAQLAAKSGYVAEPAFLELASPDLPGAVQRLAHRGATRIVVLPYFLAPGRHSEIDLPRIIDRLRGIHNDVKIEAAANLDGHPALVGILLDRAAAVLEEL